MELDRCSLRLPRLLPLRFQVVEAELYAELRVPKRDRATHQFRPVAEGLREDDRGDVRCGAPPRSTAASGRIRRALRDARCCRRRVTVAANERAFPRGQHSLLFLRLL